MSPVKRMKAHTEMPTFRTVIFNLKIGYLQHCWALCVCVCVCMNISMCMCVCTRVCVSRRMCISAIVPRQISPPMHRSNCLECSKKLLRIQDFILHKSLHYPQHNQMDSADLHTALVQPGHKLARRQTHVHFMLLPQKTRKR